jgi:hypothetical protein
MRSPASDISPLTLFEQLDAMLLGWLERHATAEGRVDRVAKGVVTVLDSQVEEVERFCASWELAVKRLGAPAPWVVLVVTGRELPVRGFTEITALIRR